MRSLVSDLEHARQFASLRPAIQHVALGAAWVAVHIGDARLFADGLRVACAPTEYPDADSGQPNPFATSTATKAEAPGATKAEAPGATADWVLSSASWAAAAADTSNDAMWLACLAHSMLAAFPRAAATCPGSGFCDTGAPSKAQVLDTDSLDKVTCHLVSSKLEDVRRAIGDLKRAAVEGWSSEARARLARLAAAHAPLARPLTQLMDRVHKFPAVAILRARTATHHVVRWCGLALRAADQCRCASTLYARHVRVPLTCCCR